MQVNYFQLKKEYHNLFLQKAREEMKNPSGGGMSRSMTSTTGDICFHVLHVCAGKREEGRGNDGIGG